MLRSSDFNSLIEEIRRNSQASLRVFLVDDDKSFYVTKYRQCEVFDAVEEAMRREGHHSKYKVMCYQSEEEKGRRVFVGCTLESFWCRYYTTPVRDSLIGHLSLRLPIFLHQ